MTSVAPGALTVAPAAPAHAAALALVHAAAFPPGQRWDAAALAQQLALPGVQGLAAVTTGEAPAGFILTRVAADEAEVLTLAVLPAWRRRGVGALILRSALERVAAAGAGTVFLEVSPENPAALALYARAGFVQVGRRRGYYPGGGDALVLRRAVSPGAAEEGGCRRPGA